MAYHVLSELQLTMIYCIVIVKVKYMELHV